MRLDGQIRADMRPDRRDRKVITGLRIDRNSSESEYKQQSRTPRCSATPGLPIALFPRLVGGRLLPYLLTNLALVWSPPVARIMLSTVRSVELECYKLDSIHFDFEE